MGMVNRGIIHVFGGGTFLDVAPHFSLSARATGKTAIEIGHLLDRMSDSYVSLHLTRQAWTNSSLVTPNDVKRRLDEVLADSSTKMIFFSCAMVDFSGEVLSPLGPYKPNERLRTDDGPLRLMLTPTEKIIRTIRKTRKDIFLVGFKQTHGLTADEQYLAGLKLLKTASCNLVLANDGASRLNMVITPEQARYHETTDRQKALAGLVDMSLQRQKNGTFTRSTVKPGDPVPWNSPLVPDALRKVVDHCIARGAYKPFLGATVGHFAVKTALGLFLTSRRKMDYNKLNEVGLVLVESKGDHEVIAYGSKPSVGGQSQRIVFDEHPDVDCIVHFHCPLKAGSFIHVAEQRPYECGSHQCGQNTSRNLTRYDEFGPGLYAVMLDKHGPNIVFNSKTANPDDVIRFIEDNWDLGGRTDNVNADAAREYADKPASANV